MSYEKQRYFIKIFAIPLKYPKTSYFLLALLLKISFPNYKESSLVRLKITTPRSTISKA